MYSFSRIILTGVSILTLFFPPLLVAPSAAPTFTVNNPADIPVLTGPLDNGVCETELGNGVCTLRAAVIKASHYPGGGVTILLPALPGGQAYRLTIPTDMDNTESTASLDVYQSMTVIGDGLDRTIIDSAAIPTPIFYTVVSDLRLEKLTLRNAHGTGGGGAIVTYRGQLWLQDVRLTGNTANGPTAKGAGINAHETVLEIHNSRIDNNHTSNGGAGIYCDLCLLKMTAATLDHNQAAGNGGALLAMAPQSGSYIHRTTIHDNHAGLDGGGIANELGGALNVINTTIVRNTAGRSGGGISNDSLAIGDPVTRLYNLTLADNQANQAALGGGGAGVYNFGTAGQFVVNNSILARNEHPNNSQTLSLPSDCAGELDSRGYNIIYGFTPGSCQVTRPFTQVDPLLASSLQDNGGPTHTLALLPDAPAIDAGEASGCTDQTGAHITTDQRGYPRPAGGRCDLGAYEAQLTLYLPLLLKK